MYCVHSLLQGIVPEPEEQEELIAMNTELLNRVPRENDPFVIDPDQELGMVQGGLHVIYIRQYREIIACSYSVILYLYILHMYCCIELVHTVYIL